VALQAENPRFNQTCDIDNFNSKFNGPENNESQIGF